jgi:hypothetical protein
MKTLLNWLVTKKHSNFEWYILAPVVWVTFINYGLGLALSISVLAALTSAMLETLNKS